jgi:hypothetical protein
MIALLLIALIAPSQEPQSQVFNAPKFGLTLTLPANWRILARERDDRILVAGAPSKAEGARPALIICELGISPESLDEYRSRLETSARRGARTLIKNALVEAPGGARLETERDLIVPQGEPERRELAIRISKNRQLYTFILQAEEPAWNTAREAFVGVVDAAVFGEPDTGAVLIDAKANRWKQREFGFEIDLPPDWRPALAPDEVALLFANAPAKGVWADNLVVVAHRRGSQDFDALVKSMPGELAAVDPGCEIVACKQVDRGGRSALETIVRTRRGPFSMTVIEWRFRGDRFDYEVKFTLETDRFENLRPTLEQSLKSFHETAEILPGTKAG